MSIDQPMSAFIAWFNEQATAYGLRRQRYLLKCLARRNERVKQVAELAKRGRFGEALDLAAAARRKIEKAYRQQIV